MTMYVYFERKGAKGKSVTSTHLVALLMIWAGKIGFDQLGFHQYEIGSHSLRSGGAMTLHQSGQYVSTTKVIGRWSSDAFLIYLQEQLTTFTEGVSAAIKQVMWFTITDRTPLKLLPSKQC